MDGVWTGICIGSAVLVVGRFIDFIVKSKKAKKDESKQTNDNTARIETLETTGEETRCLCKATLNMCITIGEGMMLNGFNGDFKEAFCKERAKAMTLLK